MSHPTRVDGLAYTHTHTHTLAHIYVYVCVRSCECVWNEQIVLKSFFSKNKELQYWPVEHDSKCFPIS